MAARTSTTRNSSSVAKVDLKPGIYAGSAISALLLLLPYVNLVFVPAYVLGPLAGAWFELRRRSWQLNFTQGATLGFYSAFYGTITAIAFDQIATRFFHEQLWRFENIYRLPPLLASKGLDIDTPGGWYLLMLQIVIIAIFAGAVGAPAGILGVKLFGRSPRS
jgi:hypothetical protein